MPLFTVDQPEPHILAAGTIPELHATGSFGSRARERLAALRVQQPTGPLMCSEFWCGWFDHWGAHHHTTSAADAARELDEGMDAGASVNIYMLHGGTNFGLTNGANDKGVYQPIVTSYDYDAPLDEAGRPTEKFWAFREVISRYAPVPTMERADSQPFLVPESAPLTCVGALADLAEEEWRDHDQLPTMDDLGQSRGFVRYRRELAGGDGPATLSFDGVRDRAWVSIDGVPVGTLSRSLHESAITLPRANGTLEILIEDEGRVNYGPRLGEQKGLIGPARLDGAELLGWQTAVVVLDGLPEAAVAATPRSMPAGASVHRASVALGAPTDLSMSTRGLGKGLVWVNGFCLGRYWQAGPQRSLFVPAPVTRAGQNEIVVLELDTLTTPAIDFLDDLDLGHLEF